MSVCPSVLLCPIRFSNSAINITMRRISSLKSPNPFFQVHLPPPAPTYWIIWPQVRIQEKGGGGERNCINRVPSPPLISPATKKVFFVASLIVLRNFCIRLPWYLKRKEWHFYILYKEMQTKEVCLFIFSVLILCF